jgi:hypothetical protein
MTRRYRVVHPYLCYWNLSQPTMLPVGAVGELMDNGRYYSFRLSSGLELRVFIHFVETFGLFFQEEK